MKPVPTTTHSLSEVKQTSLRLLSDRARRSYFIHNCYRTCQDLKSTHMDVSVL